MTQLRSEDFFKILFTAQHHLHPNSRILSEEQILIFKRVARQNPPVLQPLKMVCSRSQHPLSSGSGRRRYNTLDFAQQNRVPTGCFHPYWKPRIQGICYPFEIPAVLESVPTSCKSKLADSDPKTKNPQRVPQTRRGILWGFVVDTRKKDSVKIQLSFSYFSSPQGASADLLPML